MTNSWDRQPGESRQAFEAFRCYRDMGPSRTLDAAFRKRTGKLGRPYGGWKNWYSRHSWKARAEALDAELDRVRLSKRKEQVEEMVKRHARDFRLAEKLAAAILGRLAGQAAELDVRDPGTAKVVGLWIRALDLAAQGERRLGEPLDIQKPTFSAGSNNELDLSHIDALVDELVAEGKI